MSDLQTLPQYRSAAFTIADAWPSMVIHLQTCFDIATPSACRGLVCPAIINKLSGSTPFKQRLPPLPFVATLAPLNAILLPIDSSLSIAPQNCGPIVKASAP